MLVDSSKTTVYDHRVALIARSCWACAYDIACVHRLQNRLLLVNGGNVGNYNDWMTVGTIESKTFSLDPSSFIRFLCRSVNLRSAPS